MYSFWLPQIAYSAYSGTKNPFHPLYLVGTALTRLFIPLYFLGCPNSFLTVLAAYFSPSGQSAQQQEEHMSTSYTACYVLVVWVSFQVVMLWLQSLYGPRFFVPKQFLPVRYDYRRPIPANLRSSSGGSSGSSGGDDDGADDGSSGPVLRDRGSSRGSRENRDYSAADDGDLEMGLLEHQRGLECVICYNPVNVWSGNHMV